MKQSALKRARYLSFLVASVGVGLTFWSGRYLASHRLLASRFPVDLTAGKLTRRDFHVDFDSAYSLDLGVASGYGARGTLGPLSLELKCALGIERPHWEKCSTSSRLDLSWAVYSGDRKIAGDRIEGQQDSTLWSGSPARTLGSFSAKRGMDYRVEIRNDRDAGTALSSAHPEVLIRAPASAVKDSSLPARRFRKVGVIAITVGVSAGLLLTWVCLL